MNELAARLLVAHSVHIVNVVRRHQLTYNIFHGFRTLYRMEFQK